MGTIKTKVEAGARALKGKRVLICEEALKNQVGHWYEYNKATVSILRSEGAEVEVLGHQELDLAIAEELNAKPYFRWTNWDQIYYHPSKWKRYIGILHHNWRVYRAVDRYLSKAGSYDLVFVPTVIIYHLLAWRFLAMKYGGSRIGRIVLLIRNSSAQYANAEGVPEFSSSSGVLARVLSSFKGLINQGVLQFATDSHRLAEEYHQLCGVKPVVVPHPCLISENGNEVKKSNKNEVLTLCAPGPARWEKGVHLLIEALKRLKQNAELPRIRCWIQWPDRVLSPEGKEVIFLEKEFEGTGIEIKLIKDPLDAKAYEAMLQQTDVVVLPYLREAYYARISGVAVEAMLLGIPLIYTKDTWVADKVEYLGAGLGISSGDSNQLANVISDFVAKRKNLGEKARERKDQAREAFSERHFLEQLLGIKFEHSK